RLIGSIGGKDNAEVILTLADTAKEVQHLAGPTAGLNWLAWSPTGDRVAAVNGEGLFVWKASDGKLLTQAKTPGASVSWAPNGRAVSINIGGSQGIHIVELAEKSVETRLQDIGESGVAWAPNARTLTRLTPARAAVYDALKGTRLRVLTDAVEERL